MPVTLPIQQQAISLIQYIQTISQMREKTIRSIDQYDAVFWLDAAELTNELWWRIPKPSLHEDRTMYDQLFRTYQKVQKEGELYEVVLAIGLLRFDKVKALRHVLTVEGEIHFDSTSGTLSVCPVQPLTYWAYEEDMLPVEYQIGGPDYHTLTEQLERPFDWETMKHFATDWLPQFIHTLHPHGEIMDHCVRNERSEDPIISLSPAIIVRPRSKKSFQRACSVILEQLAEAEVSDVPRNIRTLFDNIDPVPTAKKETSHYYFPLPANDEQKRIMSWLEKEPNVLVQGPPGTGKTHTIANITAHLLASGKRVLITSETQKALRVIKDKLPEEFQSFIVRQLGKDQASLEDLTQVVKTIADEKDTLDTDQLKREVASDDEQIQRLETEILAIVENILSMRSREGKRWNLTENYRGTPEQIAKRVAANAHRFDWYEAPLSDSYDFARQERMFVQRYIARKKELDRLDAQLPLGDPLPRSIHFPSIIDHVRKEMKWKEQLRPYRDIREDALEEQLLYLSSAELTRLDHMLKEGEDLLQSLAIHAYPSIGQLVDEVFDEDTSSIYSIRETLQRELLKMERFTLSFKRSLVSIPEEMDYASLEAMTEDLMQYVRNGGKLTGFLFTPRFVKPYEEELSRIRYNGRPIDTAEQLKRIDAFAKTKVAQKIITQTVPELCTQSDELDRCLERIRQYVFELGKVLQFATWREELRQLHEFLKFSPLRASTLRTLHGNVKAVRILKEMQFDTMAIETATSELFRCSQLDRTPLYQQMAKSLQERDLQTFQHAVEKYEEAEHLWELRLYVEQTKEQLLRHTPHLFQTVEATYTQPVWEERMNDWTKAKEWYEAKQWLAKNATRDENDYLRHYETLLLRRQQLLTRAGAKRAWIHLIESMSSHAAKHLKAWVQSARLANETTGKQAARHMIQAKHHMKECQVAVPAWIMPLTQVFDEFDIEPEMFDVVIIDEASQSWHDALLLNYIGKQLVVVGDAKQISPSNIGIRQDDLDKLKEKYFAGFEFPFVHQLDRNNSYFDFAHTILQKTVTLREHFRCMPEIIEFSNKIAYDGDQRLYPLRLFDQSRLLPIRTTFVEDGKRENQVNKREAAAIVEEVLRCLQNPAYANKTIGIISLTGKEQANYIQEQLFKKVDPHILAERRLVAGDAYTFQGDERDIIFLSMVVSKDENLRAQTQKHIYERYNVATSRARDQLWLFHSVQVEHIKNEKCLRRQLLTYMHSPLALDQKTQNVNSMTQFQRDIYNVLIANDYFVYPNFPVADQSVDLVVEKEGIRTAVFCRSSENFVDRNGVLQDFQFEQMLRRAGWRIVTVRASLFYQDEERAVHQLLQTLQND